MSFFGLKLPWPRQDSDGMVEVYKNLHNDLQLREIATNDSDADVREIAVEHLRDQGYLALVATSSRHTGTQKLACERLRWQGDIRKVARNAEHVGKDIRLIAVERLYSIPVLQTLADADPEPAIREAAKTQLNDIHAHLWFAKTPDGHEHGPCVFHRLADFCIAKAFESKSEAELILIRKGPDGPWESLEGKPQADNPGHKDIKEVYYQLFTRQFDPCEADHSMWRHESLRAVFHPSSPPSQRLTSSIEALDTSDAARLFLGDEFLRRHWVQQSFEYSTLGTLVVGECEYLAEIRLHSAVLDMDLVRWGGTLERDLVKGEPIGHGRFPAAPSFFRGLIPQLVRGFVFDISLPPHVVCDFAERLRNAHAERGATGHHRGDAGSPCIEMTLHVNPCRRPGMGCYHVGCNVLKLGFLHEEDNSTWALDSTTNFIHLDEPG